MISQSITESLYRILGNSPEQISHTNNDIVNIENYTFSGTTLLNRARKNSNYFNQYEVINLSGRRENNLSIRDIPISSTFNQTIINNQNLSRAILSRNKNKSIIAVKFSAPGGKRTDSFQNMDLESSEYSSNNGINNRNYEARFTQSQDLIQHTDLEFTSTYTKHKINKNTRYLMNSNDLIYSKSDNGYISYQIPYHISQIQWFNNLYKNRDDLKNHYIVFNHQTGSEFYFTSTQEGLSEYLTNDYPSQVGWSSWQQLKAGKSWKHRKIKDESYFYLDRKDSIQDARGARVNPLFLIHTNTSDLSIYEDTFIVKEPIIDYSQDYLKNIEEEYQIDRVVYKNSFHNDNLNNLNNIQDNQEDIIGEYDFKKKQIFPKAKDSGLYRTRSRTKYIYPHWRGMYANLSEDGLTASIDLLNSAYRNIISSSDKYLPIFFPGTPNYGQQVSFGICSWPFFSSLIDQNTVGELSYLQEVYMAAEPKCMPNASFCPAFDPNPIGYKWTQFYTSFLQANSFPFYNSNEDFELDYVKKYKNYSTIPEFNITYKININNFENITDELYNKSFEFYNTGSHLNNLSEKINIKNKLSFNINSIIKLRPYKNFYPAFMYLKSANIFSSTLSLDDINKRSPNFIYSNNNNGKFTAYYLSRLMLEFFSPGVLGNSIACGHPIKFSNGSSINESSEENLYFTNSFENIFDPLSFINGKTFNFWNDSLAIPQTSSLNIKVNMNYYKNIINNFLQEVRYSFCKNSSLEYFVSKKQEDFGIFESGKKYVLNLSLDVGKLDYTVDNHIDNGVIGGVSFIGNFGIVSVDGDRSRSVNNDPCWNPNFVDNFENIGYKNIRICFSPTITRKYTIDEIFANSVVYYSNNYNSFNEVVDTEMHKLSDTFNLFEKDDDYWKIKSKWEFPYLVMTNSILKYNLTDDDRTLSRTRLEETETNYNLLSYYKTGSYTGGLWYDYCEIPSQEQGLFIKLLDHEFYSGSNVVYKSSSLADVVGFKKETKRVGELNEQKEISELICIVPIDSEDNSFFRLEQNTELYKNNKKLFEKYILPPKLDFTIQGISPSIMFCYEIKDIWSKKDLSYIWQNLLPQNGLGYKHISDIYEVTEESVLEKLKNRDVYFMVFKCKLRSVTNPPGTYGVNWPYDEFSLVELIKVDAITGK